jgi:hypothetical protein
MKIASMDEQTFSWPDGANKTLRAQNRSSLHFAQEPVKEHDGIQQRAYGERLEALAQIYLELSVPLPIALRAAWADLRQLGE